MIAVLVRADLSKDAELLVLRHDNAVLHRLVARVRYGGSNAARSMPGLCLPNARITAGAGCFPAPQVCPAFRTERV
ncbi:MAG: hypothetical protein ACRDQG_04490 [Pseudonocardiaceae bacterium]